MIYVPYQKKLQSKAIRKYRKYWDYKRSDVETIQPMKTVLFFIFAIYTWTADITSVFTLKEGPAKTYWQNGAPKLEYTIKNGKLHGTKLQWHSNGVLKFKAYYLKGQLHGLSQSFSESGTLLSQAFYFHDKKTGIQCQWRDDSSPISQISYSNGKRDGISIIWNPDRSLKEISNYRNGKLHGKFIQFRDGNPSRSLLFRDGKPTPQKSH
jgi:antitoxin component YwqK of YwqJK toxin-antitoxin module